jgi:hypothetical protein
MVETKLRSDISGAENRLKGATACVFLGKSSKAPRFHGNPY